VILTVGTVEILKGRRGRRGVGRPGMMRRMKRTSQRRAGTSQTEEDDETGIVLSRMKEEDSARKTDGAQEDLMGKTEFLLGIDETDGAVVTSRTITIGIDIDDTEAMTTILHTDGDAIEAVLHLLAIRAGKRSETLAEPDGDAAEGGSHKLSSSTPSDDREAELRRKLKAKYRAGDDVEQKTPHSRSRSRGRSPTPVPHPNKRRRISLEPPSSPNRTARSLSSMSRSPSPPSRSHSHTSQLPIQNG